MISLTGLSVEQARRAIAAQLTAHGLDTPDLDARLLTGAVLGLDLTGLSVQALRLLKSAEARRLKSFVDRRIQKEPVARIIGTKEFWGLPLRLSPETLTPRPDTEIVVETALALLGNDARGRPRVIADLGVGSGAILLALLSELPLCVGVGADISVGALRMARVNARNLGLAQRAAFVACDYAAAIRGDIDVIVSNPPYIRSAEIDMLAPEVRDHDPRGALDGGVDGLDAYRTIAADAARLLAPGGVIVVEVGYDQSHDVAQIFGRAGLLQAAAPAFDLAGIPRAISGRKPQI